ncbi:hypothetical protein [Levilactobacillus brevis]|uniref:hypothetical protein n=1 Tax=Levilactobacillus brevis TaxID=1580 RepID=UPI001BDEF7F7|nr:hypothetical protein [Levilactobacillus brevis]
MNMKKLVAIGITAISSLLIISGCGRNSNSSRRTSSVQDNKIAFYKDAQQNDRWWFRASADDNDDLSKSSLVTGIWHTKNGKVTRYNTLGNGKLLSLGKISKMSDAALTYYAKKKDAQEFKNGQKEEIQGLKEDLAIDKKNGLPAAILKSDASKLKQAESDSYSAPQPERIKIAATTDSSGKSMSTEVVYAGTGYHQITMMTINSPRVQRTIFDKYAVGYVLEDNEGYAVTLTNNKKLETKFDSIKTKGITINDN